MSRPSKRKRASRTNLLKARAKMSILRTAHDNLDSDKTSEEVKAVPVFDHVGSVRMANGDYDQARAGLQDSNVDVVVQSGVDMRLERHPNQNLDSTTSTNQSVEGGLHEEPLIENFPHASSESMGIAIDPTREEEIGQYSVPVPAAELTRPTRKSSNSYLRAYKETFRESKRMKVGQFSAVKRDTWARPGGETLPE
ncbi:hypothetical protein RSOLAG1IB_08288 [Rhizoctonia solani AG-1 IB]|uniref:Uncharacterized protein n=1 Tax=Thanatephorus cucumeris (strain AG1-IB / isolate 7/3/14) TaxID=1108050 RepID=A0A0B7FHC8_THACB|nr:hypothetical protein RSOLAG1IB_08288 [Rhizoctonia solani AG-1 IB]